MPRCLLLLQLLRECRMWAGTGTNCVHPARPPSPATPHFLAAPGVSNSRPCKFQAQPPRKPRTFPQSSGWRKGSSKTAPSAPNTLRPQDASPPAPAALPGLPSCPQDPHPYPSASWLSARYVLGTGPRALPSPAHVFLPTIQQSLSQLPLCAWGTERRLFPTWSVPTQTGLGSPGQVCH